MEIAKLLEHCLNVNHFLYNCQLITQFDSVAMGSAVGPIVVNIWMEDFEHAAIPTAPSTIKL